MVSFFYLQYLKKKYFLMGDKKIKKTQPEKKSETDKVLKKLEKVETTYNLINKCLDKVEETVRRIESTVEKITTKSTRVQVVKNN